MLAMILGSLPANAQTETRQEPEPEVHPVRALLELQAVFLLGVVYYGATGNSDSGFSVNYDWDVFRRKISGQSFDSDKNHFTTNFVGHPLGGAGYYLSARTNGFSTLASSAVSVTGSLVWELFGEPKEEISMNDTIVTPMAGIAIGETTFQVANFFNRSAPTWINKALGTVIGPFTALNQRVDGTEPQRVASGYPNDGWHQLDASLGFYQVHERHSQRFIPTGEVELQAQIRTETLALPTALTPLQLGTFHEGNVAQFVLNTAYSGEKFSRVEVVCHSVLAGLNYAASRNASDAEFGYLGLGMGFTFTSRDYLRTDNGERSHWSSTRPVHLATGHHVKRGKFALDAWAAIGPAFSGVDALALDLTQQKADFPVVTRERGYYFGWGMFSQAAVQVNYDAFVVNASALTESAYATRAPGEDPVPAMHDVHQFGSAAVGYKIPTTSTRLQLFGSHRLRRSHVLESSSEYQEFTTGLQLVAQTQ